MFKMAALPIVSKNQVEVIKQEMDRIRGYNKQISIYFPPSTRFDRLLVPWKGI